MISSSVEQIRVETLARKLGVSKGSFYWHFADRQDLLAGVLKHWLEKCTLEIQARLDMAEPRPSVRLLLFMQLPFKSEASLRAADMELAIQGWARRDPKVRAAVEVVDRLRTEHLRNLFIEMGLDFSEATYRGHQAYGFLRYAAQRRDLEVEERAQLTARVHADLTSDLEL